MSSILTLLADSTRSDLMWEHLPPTWVLVMVLVPLAIFVGWWGYQRETELSRSRRLTLSALRTTALLLFLIVLFGPFVQRSDTVTRKAHLLLLLDTSASMGTVDGYEAADAERLAQAAGVSANTVGDMTRLDLARKVLTRRESGLLDYFTDEFRFHAYTFGSNLTPIVSTGDDEVESDIPERDIVAARLEGVRAEEPATRLGQAVGLALDAFRRRNENVAGVVVVSDGRQNGGSVEIRQAGRRANQQDVPIFTVGVGDPRPPKNVQVGNLLANEVVLARDTAAFEFGVRALGFEGRSAEVELQVLDGNGQPTGSPLQITPDVVGLVGGTEEQKVKVSHTFKRAGTYALRIGIPVQDDERIKSDNFLFHTIRVIDRRIKVLYVDGSARWEQQYLSNSLTRDFQTLLAHTLLLDADPDTPQRASMSPGWEPLQTSDGIPDREALFEYDVIIIGDVDWKDLDARRDEAEEALANLKDFVDKGGGLVMLAGTRHNPTKYRDQSLAAVLPILIDRSAERLDRPTGESFAFRVTPEGRRSPLMQVAGTPEASARLWEETEEWRQWWSYPALRAKTGARVLAVSGDPRHTNKFGPRPLIATMRFGRGSVLYVGVDELWRTRHEAGDHFYYGFWGQAIRYLATYKLLGGNKRFKILTDKDSYNLDEPVRITLDVLDRDYEPSRRDSQTVFLELPGEEPGRRDTIELEVPRDSQEDGTFRKTIVPTRPGEYRLYAETDDEDDERPEKMFQVVHSSVELRELLLDAESLDALATESAGGEYMHLAELADDARLRPAPRSTQVDVNRDRAPVWDNPWTLLLALGVLGAEWMLRKRWRLV